MADEVEDKKMTLETRLYFITSLVTIGITWGSLHQQVADNTARLEKHDVEISTLKQTVGSQAVVLGRIEQKIDDIRCIENGRGCPK